MKHNRILQQDYVVSFQIALPSAVRLPQNSPRRFLIGEREPNGASQTQQNGFKRFAELTAYRCSRVLRAGA